MAYAEWIIVDIINASKEELKIKNAIHQWCVMSPPSPVSN